MNSSGEIDCFFGTVIKVEDELDNLETVSYTHLLVAINKSKSVYINFDIKFIFVNSKVVKNVK